MDATFERQHPIPQQISSYQFRLVGDMTIKQFFQVAGGALIAILIYSSNLIAFIKWPSMIGFFLFGIALAFFPLEDRPLDKWIILFFKSIYSPTLFTWKKTKQVEYFRSEATAEEQTQSLMEPSLESVAPDIQQSAAPVGIHKEATEALAGLEQGEEVFLSKLRQHFDDTSPAPQPTTTSVASPSNQQGTQTQETKEVKDVGKDAFTINTITSDQGQQSNQDPTQTIEQVLNIPKQETVAIDKSQNMSQAATVRQVAVQEDEVLGATRQVQQSATQNIAAPKQATFSPDAAPPIPPIQPNLVVGQTMADDGSILEGVILEIRDSDGRPARALKSNQLGHFGIVTPLVNGTYKIITEKEGYIFDPIFIEVEGEIVEPIAIRARQSTQSN